MCRENAHSPNHSYNTKVNELKAFTELFYILASEQYCTVKSEQKMSVITLKSV
jgi:hypothetical protein